MLENSIQLIEEYLFLSIAKGLVFTGIVARLFTLQISENKKYLTLQIKID